MLMSIELQKKTNNSLTTVEIWLETEKSCFGLTWMFVALVYALVLRLKGGTGWKCLWPRV